MKFVKKLLGIFLLIPLVSIAEVTVTADIQNYIASDGACAVNISFLSGTLPTSTPACGIRMKKVGGDYKQYCAALLAAFVSQKKVTMGFPSDGNACLDCGCPINWVSVDK